MHPRPSSPRPTKPRRAAAALAALTLLALTLAAPAHAGSRPSARPTVVLVHGAWADTSSWNGVVRQLQHHGYPVEVIANPLRSLSTDAAYVRQHLDAITGPVILVGHSYGAAVITNAATGAPNVNALVYVNGSVPDRGMSVASLAGPDSALSVPDPTTVFNFVPATLPPTPDTDVTLKPEVLFAAFATGLRRADAQVLAATQRPITLGALNEPSGEPAWRTIPSWYLIGTQDLVIPVTAQRTMAQRAGSAVTEVKAGHLSLITNPRAVTQVILDAAAATR